MRPHEELRRSHASDRLTVAVAVLVFVTITVTVAYSAFLDRENWVMTTLSKTIFGSQPPLLSRSLNSSTPEVNQTNWVMTTLSKTIFGSQPQLLARSLTSSAPDVNHTILMWATYFGSRPTHLLDGCPEQDRCKLTYDRSLIKNASAVLFHLRDVSVAQLPKSPSFDGQKFVAFTQESPPNSIGDVRGLPKSYFHWSMTYLNVSDVLYRYGGPWISREAAHKRGLPPLNLTYSKEEIIQQKKVRGAVWFVSNCNTASGRERALSALARVFRVDVAGQCASKANLKRLCPRGSNCDGVFGQYYFYVAAENSICQDYITEKYWGRVRYPSVPIVMRRYIYVRHLPPNSFIAMDDFESPSAMAARLTYLMDNPDEYMAYFAWRKQGWALPKDIHGWTGMCNLCTRLVRGDYSRKDDRIPDFGRWYSDQSHCEDNSFATTWSKDKT